MHKQANTDNGYTMQKGIVMKHQVTYVAVADTVSIQFAVRSVSLWCYLFIYSACFIAWRHCDFM